MEMDVIQIDEENVKKAKELFKNGVRLTADMDWLDFYGIVCLIAYLKIPEKNFSMDGMPRNRRNLDSELPKQFEMAGICWTVF